MRISKIELIPIKAQQGLMAFASLVLEDSIFLGSIGVHKKLDGSGYRLTYPTKKAGPANIILYHPITSDLSKRIEEMIVAKAKELFGE
jgi:DNA-binding cell septation regulator SpoVG